MLSIRLDKHLEKRLAHLALKTGRTKSYYAKKALEEYMEDKEDYMLAVHALEEGGKPAALETVMKKFKVRPRKASSRKARRR
jgi:RHH-type rel operon transcriptional repressor/antitoxin RelB